MILFIGLFVLFMIMNRVKGVEEKKKKKNAERKRAIQTYIQGLQSTHKVDIIHKLVEFGPRKPEL